jgi:ATP-dependent protease ClpP protease subunit
MKEILIYGPIGQATTALDVVHQFQDSKGEDILLRIHSEGGSVLDGEAILNAIRQHDGEVHAQIDGMAFSMAAVIALEVRENLTMPEDGWIMFHEVRNYSGGTQEDLERQLDQMKAMNASITSKLGAALNISEEEAAERLKEEIWMNGQQALAAGLVKAITPAAALAAHVETGQWQNVPAEFFAPRRKSQTKTQMKLFKLFKNESENPSLELAEVGPEDMGAELVAIQKDLDEAKATHAAEMIAREEKHATAMQNALDGQRAELEAKHAEALKEKDAAIVVAENSSEQRANATLAQAGHDPVDILPSETQTREERVKAEYAAINISERGGVEKRRNFRKKHRDIFGG